MLTGTSASVFLGADVAWTHGVSQSQFYLNFEWATFLGGEF